jgi:hypothetical protein
MAELASGIKADQLHVRPLLFHAGDEGGDALVVVVLTRIFQNRIFALAAHLLGDRIGRIGAFAGVVRGDEGDALRERRVGGESDDGRALVDGAVDRLDERVGVHRMHENAGRVLRERLVEGGDLLVDVIFRRAGIFRLAAELLAGLLEHFIDREPVFDARDHDVHDVFFAWLAAERIFRLGGRGTGKKCRCKDRHRGRREKSAQKSSSRPKPLPKSPRAPR